MFVYLECLIVIVYGSDGIFVVMVVYDVFIFGYGYWVGLFLGGKGF